MTTRTVTQHFIGGEWRPGDGPTLDDLNPATGRALASVPTGTAEEVDAAVAAARKAFDGGWSSSTPQERRKLLLRLSQLLAEDVMEISRISTEEMGMPHGISMGEILYAAEYLEYFAGWADKIHGEVIPVVAPGVFDYTLREPMGVVAAIIPWNAPVNLSISKLAPALAAGNVVVLKPSELAPLAPLRLAELVAKAGFPRGVVNVLTGDATTGRALVEHPGVDRIAFTGGTETGRTIGEIAGRNLKPLSLELGGKSANIVFADADLNAAALSAATGIFLNTGQACLAGSRLLVEAPVADAFVEKVSAAARGMVVGDPFQPGTVMGPVISEGALNRILGMVDEARESADVVLGGERLGGELAEGYFLPPTILTGVSNDQRIAREEVFGPVLSVIPFADEAEAIAIANDTRYGLAGGLWTTNLSRAHRVAKAIRAGTVWVNTWLLVNPGTPFGGYKDSGLGREGGQQALHSYLETKNVYVQL
ncbi:MAG: aldehyde dehydrogenase family protein [Actinomycetota bacterium]